MSNEILNNNIFKLTDICKPNSNKNTIISGLSIKMALTLLLNAAEGESKNELETFLGKSRQELNDEALKILAECGEDLKLANSCWIANPNKINKEYKEKIKKFLNAEISVENFKSTLTVDKINTWVNDNTNGLIPTVISLDNIEYATSVLINTLYFKAQWENPFSESLTKSGIFYGKDKTSDIQMMKTTTKTYFENEKIRGFNLYYENNPYEFIAVLPNEEGEFKIEELDLNNLTPKEGNYKVNVNFPRLDIQFGCELEDVIKLLGINAPFVKANDFLSMLSIPQVISKIIHKTKFKLDEKGTEAAAATVIAMDRCIAMMEEPLIEINLNFNRPFAFIIRHRVTSELLFVGKINNL